MGSNEHSNEPSDLIIAGTFLTRWATISTSRRNVRHGVSI